MACSLRPSLNVFWQKACLFLLLLVFLCPAPALAWDARLADAPNLPGSLVVINKGIKKLYLLEKQSPLTLKNVYPSIHGELEGDKQIEGDLRTPEGVYFVTGRIRTPLDFDEYGSEAHALNYPNPMDRLHGKTGGGIWIHSKGQPIAGQATRGCIAIDLDNIAVLGQKLTPGMPVLVAQNVEILTDNPSNLGNGSVPVTLFNEAGLNPGNTLADYLVAQTISWNKAWAARSSDFFTFYDPASYTKAQGESFEAFKNQKERLFQSFPWIQILFGEVHALEGPDYWVTWFSQYYRAPNLTTEGTRRLYWKPVQGELKIVGMEWIPEDLGMERAYLETLVPSVTAFVEEWRQSWEKGDLKTYLAFYREDAVQEGRKGIGAIEKHKIDTWKTRKPAKVDLLGPRVRLSDRGVRVDMTQVYKNVAGYQDKGVKELFLYPDGSSWKIVSESWVATP